MKRLRAIVFLGAVLLISGRMLLPPNVAAQTTQSTGTETAHKLTFDGEIALWTVAVRSDKTGDFEQIMTKLREALMKSEKAERRQQAVGWRVMKVSTPLPDGNIAYVHVITPVVPGADYAIMQILYDEFPDERQTLYHLYRGAFAKSLSLASGGVVVDMTKTTQSASR